MEISTSDLEKGLRKFRNFRLQCENKIAKLTDKIEKLKLKEEAIEKELGDRLSKKGTYN